MDTQPTGFPQGDIRVSDADRDQAVTELSEHFQTGRLTQDEFEDRSSRALSARTGRDLSALFTDLPHRPAAASAAGSGTGASPVTPAGGYGVPARRPGPPLRAVIGLVIVAAIVAGVLGHGFGWLVPVVIVGFVFLRVLGGHHHHHHRGRHDRY